MLHKQKFAINLVATPFLEGFFFCDATQEKVCNKFCSNPIFGRKFFFIKLHKQKIALNFVANPYLGESFFSYSTQAKVCNKICKK